MGEETGNDKAVEAIKIKLSGEASSEYHVYYRVHVSNIGWLDWTADGAPAGTKHYKYPIEAIQVEVIPDDADNVPEMGKAYK